MSMDMSISGSGKIPAGEYEKVSVSGSGHLYGKVRCLSFSTSGSSDGESVECAESFKVSGSASFSGDVKAKSISVSGSLSCGGVIKADEKISCSGSAKCKNDLKCNQLSVSGMLTVGGDIEAEKVTVDGVVNCDGLLNAESIEIKFDRGMNIGSIGGSKIVVFPKNSIKSLKKLPLFSFLVKSASTDVNVSSSIEGDEIALEGVVCPRVTGRVVAIEKGCNIELVQYSEAVEISPEATVGSTEKI